MNAIRLGIIGAGSATNELHLPALLEVPSIEVAAIADTDPHRLSAVADRYKIAQRYHDGEELIADQALEAVAICTPAEAHTNLTLSALTAGKHVFVEKPLALTVADGERMAAAAARSSNVSAVGFNLRCHRLVQKARDLIASAAFGQVQQISTVWGSSIQHAPDLASWRRRSASGGGSLFEMGVHHIDLFRFLLEDEIETVRMVERSGDCEMESVSLLLKSASNVLITSSLSQRTANVHDLRIIGDRASASCSLFQTDSFHFLSLDQPPGGLRARWHQLPRLRELPELIGIARSGGDYLQSYRREWTDFAEAVRGNKSRLASFADGLAALKIAHAALNNRV